MPASKDHKRMLAMKSTQTFDADDKTLESILFSNRKYRVPRYQRPYAWDVEQIDEFWEDLDSTNDPSFMGSFIFDIEGEGTDGYVDIIDGQQRLLTVTIFMAVLRDLALSIDPAVAKLYQRQDIAIEDRSGKQMYRILPSDTLRDYFEEYVQSGEKDITKSRPSNQEEARVKRNYEWLKKRLAEEMNKYGDAKDQVSYLDRLRKRIAEIVVISVEVSKEEDAYEIFETTNARGVDLSIGDLLKNLIFKRMPPEQGRDLAKEIWQQITSYVEDTDTDLKRFIRYFWISRHRFVPEKRVYREVKNNTQDWGKLLEDLWDDSVRYHRLLEGGEGDFEVYKHPHRLYEATFALRLMRVSQCFVFLMCILRNYDDLDTDPVRYFEFIERFTFQYSVISKQPGNKIEKVYSKYAIELEKILRSASHKARSGRIQSTLASLKRDLALEAPSYPVFMAAWDELSYKNSEQGRQLMKYILGRIDGHYRQNDENVINFSSVNIEHILPQRPSKHWGVAREDIRGYVNLLGNLTLLSTRINSRVQNGPISQKLPEFTKSQLPVTQELVKQLTNLNGQWGEKEIRERQRQLGELAYHEVWKLS
jgi:uncharacterized protein with ParB-like and HNH nuclease domain